MRKNHDELVEIKKQYNIDTLYSWSRVNTYHNSKYEYLLKYIKHVDEDRNDCAYAPLGGAIHDILEKYYTNLIKYENMFECFRDVWITWIDVAQLKFDRNDSDKNANIVSKYYKALEHFFQNHAIIPYKTEIERFIVIPLTENKVLQGYMDVVFKDNNGNYIIGDFKSSTIYKGKKAINECGQLVMYAIGLHALGVPYNKIRIAWNFLKYQNVTITQKNDKTKVRQISRHELGDKLKTNVTMWLKHFNYKSNQIDTIILEFINSNDVNVLPLEVQSKLSFDDCWVYVDLTEDLINEKRQEVISIIDEIEAKEAEYKITKDNNLFWDTLEEVKEQSYYYATLCSYSPNLILPYKAYLEELDSKKEREDLLLTDDSSMDWLNAI